jgi:hypothetical protein
MGLFLARGVGCWIILLLNVYAAMRIMTIVFNGEQILQADGLYDKIVCDSAGM